MQDDELTWMPAWRVRQLILERELSAVEVTRHFLDRIERLDPLLHAFITVAAESALNQARDTDRALSEHQDAGPLFGVPVSIKDHFWTRGIRTTAGSLLFQNHMPEEDSVYAERLRSAGAIIVGKTNTPEFELFYRTKNLISAECVNPWDRSRVSGGSSGGAAASVASGMTPIAVGSDTGGSIRIPAAFCGVFGLVPTNGRVPRHGNFGATLFFSGVGPMTRDVRDAALLLQALAGPDSRDPTALTTAAPDYLKDLNAGVRDLRMGWWSEWESVDSLDQAVLSETREAAYAFTKLGARVETVPKLTLDEAMRAFWVINDADHYAFLGEGLYEDSLTRAKLTPYVRARFSGAQQVKAVDYPRALYTRFRFMREIEKLFEKYDLLLSPTMGVVAPPVEGERYAASGYAASSIIAYTFVANFAGIPAATIPCGFVDGVPVGLQVLGPPDGESAIFRACHVFAELRPLNAHPTGLA